TTPTCPYTYRTRPEQSKPDGLDPPHRYGAPTYCFATATTVRPRVASADCESTGTGTETFAQPASDAEMPTNITKPAMSPIIPFTSNGLSPVLGAGLDRSPRALHHQRAVHADRRRRRPGQIGDQLLVDIH